MSDRVVEAGPIAHVVERALTDGSHVYVVVVHAEDGLSPALSLHMEDEASAHELFRLLHASCTGTSND